MPPGTPRRPDRPSQRPRRRRPQSRWGDSGWPPASKPIPVEGGLLARSKRGPIGETWWSQHFVAALQSIGVGARLQRGKHYARIGQVIEMEIASGRVTALVQGSRAEPYRVSITTPVLPVRVWQAAEDAMAERAVFMAKLLAGEMPEEIEEAFAGSRRSLLPSSTSDLDSSCSCPDRENPCKHIAAVYFLLAEAFDADPFLIFAWRGRGKEELLTGLRARRRTTSRRDSLSDSSERAPDKGAGEGHEGLMRGLFGFPTPEQDDGFSGSATHQTWLWGCPDDLGALDIRPRLAVAPDLILRQADPTHLGRSAAVITESLRPMYEAITSGAAELALGEPAREHRH
jgi:uncharacterized Zn finger protein